MKNLTIEQLEKRKRINKKIILFGVLPSILLLIIVLLIPADPVNNSPGPSKLTKQETDSIKHLNFVKSQFDSLEGYHIKSVEAIMDKMNDASSFEHIETKYWDYDKMGLRVSTRFRGKNGFGALVQQTVITIIDTTGNIIDMHPE